VQDITTADNLGATTGKPQTTTEEMLNSIRDSLSDLPCSDDKQDGEDKLDDEEETELGKFSEYAEPGRVMGTISNMVLHHLESFRQKQMRLDEMTQL
jgi:hypothetical protein